MIELDIIQVMENGECNTMKGFKLAIEYKAIENSKFRNVPFASDHIELVLMSLLPNNEIGSEPHKENDRFFRVEKGNGRCMIDGNNYPLYEGDALISPAGAKHKLINSSSTEPFKHYTISSLTRHNEGIVRKTKHVTKTIKEVFDGNTTV